MAIKSDSESKSRSVLTFSQVRREGQIWCSTGAIFCLASLFHRPGGWILQSWANAVPGSVRSRILSRCGADRIFFTASSAKSRSFRFCEKVRAGSVAGWEKGVFLFRPASLSDYSDRAKTRRQIIPWQPFRLFTLSFDVVLLRTIIPLHSLFPAGILWMLIS